MRPYTHLTQEQRYQISALLKGKIPQTRIAQIIGVHKSTISREVRRNRCTSRYFPAQAQRLALDRRRDKSVVRICTQTWALVEEKLREKWSPEQIAGWLKATGLPRVSHERIYRHVQHDRDRHSGTLYQHLRHGTKRRRRYGSYRRAGPIPNRVGIEQRPAIVDDRKRLGDWEADTVIGKGRPVLVTLVERCSRLTRIARVARRGAEEVEAAMVELLCPLADRVHTVTCDNGSEFVRHASMASSLEASFFFAHPYASWERGLNENTNGLIRQYFPKSYDFSEATNEQIEVVMQSLNNRPRKALGFKTPNEVFFQNLTVALRR
jgi:transposase, IS30 family